MRTSLQPKLINVIISPMMLMLVLIILQLIGLLIGIWWLSDKLEYVYALHFVLTLVIIIWIINRETNPSFRMTWIILVTMVPVAGGLLFLFAHFLPSSKRLRQQILDARKNLMPRLIANRSQPDLSQLPVNSRNLLHYLGSFNYLAYQQTTAHYFDSGEATFEMMLRQLKQAKKFIFLEYFIITTGKMWLEIYEILKDKAHQGVDVRLIYDGRSLFGVPHDFVKTLAKDQIKCQVYGPLGPFLLTTKNSRDHRKMMIIDNRVGFVGGMNLADEYINQTAPFGKWKDSGLMIDGEAVSSLTSSFLEMWQALDQSRENLASFITTHDRQSTAIMVPIASLPEAKENIIETVYLNLINQANSTISIATPYLILSDELVLALTSASKRGVTVNICLPGIPDKKIPFCIACSYYRRLLAAGINIYEFQPGFLHDKSIIIDEMTSIIGSINFDYRSFYTNFENAILIIDQQLAQAITADHQSIIKQSRRIDLDFRQQLPHWYILAGRVLRLFGPLM